MIDSLLFLPDVGGATMDRATMDGAAVDDASVDAPTEYIPRDDDGDAAAAAAVAASRDGHAHATRAAWMPAAAALERSAIARDALVADGLAGSLVAARGWSDLATVRAASGDLAGARLAYARAAGATDVDATLPPDLADALDDLHASLGPVTPERTAPATPRATVAAVASHSTSDDALLSDFSGGLLWLDTTDDAVEHVSPASTAAPSQTSSAIPLTTAEAPHGAPVPTDDTEPSSAPPARIAAVDAAVALAGGPVRPATTGFAARLRQLLRR